jgi:hypothetical protein
MINANELRIGNLIYFYNGLSPKEIVIVTPRFFSSLAGGQSIEKLKQEMFSELSAYFSGIPINEEWLLKRGFENDYDGCLTLLLRGNRFQWSNKKILWQQTPYNDWSSFPCEHVHQFQNLYFTLIGAEITIK